MRGTSLSSNREDAALSQRRCGFESRRGYVHAWRFVACVMVTFGSYLFLHGLGWVWFFLTFALLRFLVVFCAFSSVGRAKDS